MYEAVTSNRLEGVTASAYWVVYDEENETFWDNIPEDGAGVLWEATEWNQENPLVTDEEGRYHWDVPEGWWQVRFSKDGYDDAYSEWLCVAPPQTEINISMVSHDSPVWDTIAVFDSSILLHSSKYLKPETVGNISLSDENGNLIAFSLTWPENETSADGTVYANEFTLSVEGRTLSVGEKLIINVPENSVASYADAFMSPDSKTVTYVGDKQILLDNEIQLPQESQTEVTVMIENFEVTDILTASIDLSDVASVVSVGSLDENGQARIVLKSKFAGTANLTVGIKGTNITKTVPIIVSSSAPVFGTPTFTLPAEIKNIEESAFEGLPMTIVDIPNGCQSIGKWAFKDCTKLTQIRIPASVTSIDDTAFDGCMNVFIYGAPNSTAMTFCDSHANCTFVADNIDE